MGSALSMLNASASPAKLCAAARRHGATERVELMHAHRDAAEERQ